MSRALPYHPAKGGRPSKAHGPKLPAHEVDLLLVEGEVVTQPDGSTRRVWPTQRVIAERFEVSPSLIAAFAKQHRCTERRRSVEASLTPPPAAPAREPVPAVDAPAPSDADPEPASPESSEAVAAADDEDAASAQRRGRGRPRKNDEPLIPYEQLDRALVFGEVKVLEDGTHTTVYPTYRVLAERYGVAVSVIAQYSKTRNCLRRREQTATRVAVRTEERMIDLRADALAVGEDRLVQMIDEFLLGFERALKEGRVRADNPTDVNTFARLKAFIQGGADSRAEVRSILSLESLQERYARVMRERRDATPAMAGVIEARGVTVSETEQGAPEAKLSNGSHESEQNIRRTELSAHFPPPRALEFASRETNLGGAIRELASLARELAEQLDPSDDKDEALLETRVLRAAERVDALLERDWGAEVGHGDALDPEDEA